MLILYSFTYVYISSLIETSCGKHSFCTVYAKTRFQYFLFCSMCVQKLFYSPVFPFFMYCIFYSLGLYNEVCKVHVLSTFSFFLKYLMLRCEGNNQLLGWDSFNYYGLQSEVKSGVSIL